MKTLLVTPAVTTEVTDVPTVGFGGSREGVSTLGNCSGKNQPEGKWLYFQVGTVTWRWQAASNSIIYLLNRTKNYIFIIYTYILKCLY